ncbi:MAG: heparinase II/III family protein, partial [Candidatus Latescibacteria bacterium]|nr:heparinase II/III family protein [Candidatus Latescibacterota bacterium]
LLDLFIDTTFSLAFRYHIKTTGRPSELEIHIPLADGGRIVVPVVNPKTNSWARRRLTWKDLLSHNHWLKGRDPLRITALAFRVRIPDADPDFPVFFGFDDIELTAFGEARFAFIEPETASLPEWNERIPLRHCRPGEQLVVRGTLPFEASAAYLVIEPFTGEKRTLHRSAMFCSDDDVWSSGALETGEYPLGAGLYRCAIDAVSADGRGSVTRFTIFVTDTGFGRRHPRLLFDAGDLDNVRGRFLSGRFSGVRGVFEREAASYREKNPVESIVYDFDQYPVDNWIASLWTWFIDRIMVFREALFTNAVVFAMLGDNEAGRYCRDLMLALADFPCWNHPWMEHRGFHSYFPIGEMTEAYAIAYDLVYDLLTDEERATIRRGAVENYVKPTFVTYVEQNRITVNTSNWISHIAGGALLALAAFYRDGDDAADLEPWLTGFILKEWKYMTTVFGRDGSYGEGFRYYNFAMQSFARVLPMLDRLFGIDLTAPVQRSYRETLWSGIPAEDINFTFGDSEGYIRGEAQADWIGGHSGPMNNWAWLVERTRDPYLSWLYHTLKTYDTFDEVLHETGDVPQKGPGGLEKTAFFRDVGTAVFKSGWGSDDFVFVFRCGPFYNHQHMDQGSFFLADHGRVFLEERYDGDHHYYDDPLYQSHAIAAVSHNTILIDGNPQSQEVGDPKGFAAGMNAHAYFTCCLDCAPFAFASGRLEDVYRGKVRELERCVLYIKPRTVLVVDRVVPGPDDVDVSLLFHTEWEKDIRLRDGRVEFHKDGPVLFLRHLSPNGVRRGIRTDPHFLCQYDRRPLIERGRLELSSKTMMTPLVFANLMTSTSDGAAPDIRTTAGNGWVGAELTVDGVSASCAVNTTGDVIDYCGFKTDALIVARDGDGKGVFTAGGTYLVSGEQILVSSGKPLAAFIEYNEDATMLMFSLTEVAEVSAVSPASPRKVTLDGVETTDYIFDGAASIVTLSLPAGSGTLE